MRESFSLFPPFSAFSFTTSLTASFVYSLTDRKRERERERKRKIQRKRDTEDVLLARECTVCLTYRFELLGKQRRESLTIFLLILVLHHHQAGNLVPSTSPSREVSQFFTTWGRKEKSWRLFFSSWRPVSFKICLLDYFSSCSSFSLPVDTLREGRNRENTLTLCFWREHHLILILQ